MRTEDRIAEAALVMFAERGVAATSLDDLARSLGLTKQTVLYHYGSKESLVRSVAGRGTDELIEVLTSALADSEAGRDRMESVVRAAFDLAVRRPELVALLREVSRLGSPVSDDVLDRLQPLIERAVTALAAARGGSDPRLLLVSIYALVTGTVTDTVALRAVGVTLDLRVAAQLRRTVLNLLRP